MRKKPSFGKPALKNLKKNICNLKARRKISGALFLTNPIQSAEAMRAHSAPYFRLSFTHVVAAVSALENLVYKVAVQHIFTVKFFHKKSIFNLHFFMQKMGKFSSNSCI